MTEQLPEEPASRATPTVVLVHGAFADSSSWSGVTERLLDRSIQVVAASNQLRSLPSDAAYVADIIATVSGPVILVGHSYGGMVITEAAAENPAVVGLVYVGGFAPDTSENALDLTAKFPGSTIGASLTSYPLSSGGNEFAIRQDVFRRQFCADVPETHAAVMAATQRPVTEAALTDHLLTEKPAWRTLPSWFVFGDLDLNIPVALHRFMAARAELRDVVELPGGSHAISVSQPEIVAETILKAVASCAA